MKANEVLLRPAPLIQKIQPTAGWLSISNRLPRGAGRLQGPDPASQVPEEALSPGRAVERRPAQAGFRLSPEDLTLIMFTITLRGKYYDHPILQVGKLRFSKCKSHLHQKPVLGATGPGTSCLLVVCAPGPWVYTRSDVYQLCDLDKALHPSEASLPVLPHLLHGVARC